MIATPESESAVLAHERTPLICSPSPIISTETSIEDSDNLKPVETGLGLPENDVACAKSGYGEGSSKGFGGVVAVMLLGSLSLLNFSRLYHHAIFFCSRKIWKACSTDDPHDYQVSSSPVQTIPLSLPRRGPSPLS